VSNYSEDPSMCRVDFFRDTGKWYATEALKLDYAAEDGPAGALQKACREQLHGRLRGMWAVCLDPYHELPFPLMVKVP
jgi:hypothetical protein